MQTEYQKYEYCRDIGCPMYSPHSGRCTMDTECIESARDFHGWLENHGYKIVKEDVGERAGNE